jgi:hypothetical protein
LARLRAASTPTKAEPAILKTMVIATVVGLTVGLFTAPFRAIEPIYFAWLHWGAYLSPVEAWLAGGLPFRDFPIQYGLGPTAVLAATCGSDCWRGIYFTTIAANALYFAVLVACVVILTAGRSRGARWLALIALWCASFVWTGFPADLGSAFMTPGVAGLRFLTIATLLLHILWTESSGRRRDWLGHIIWLCDLFWSPEAAFFGTLIWWPYLAMRDATNAGSRQASWIALVRGALRGIAALGAGVLGLVLLLSYLSAGAARPADFFAYILHPPAPMPVNPLGPVWLAVGAVLLGLQALAGKGRSSQGRVLYACLLGFLAAGTYYLSRSHDNNILNLFPLLVILLLATLQADLPEAITRPFRQAFVSTVLSAMVAFTATVVWSSWVQGVAANGLLTIGPSRLIARFDPTMQTQPQMLPSDALKALAYLRGRHAGAVVFIDPNKLMPRRPAGEGWTSVNNVANFEPLPRTWIIRSICRSAVTYGRPGWILVDEHKYSDWVRMFEAGYAVREQVDFGTYRAYRLEPRPGPLSCAELQ